MPTIKYSMLKPKQVLSQSRTNNDLFLTIEGQLLGYKKQLEETRRFANADSVRGKTPKSMHQTLNTTVKTLGGALDDTGSREIKEELKQAQLEFQDDAKLEEEAAKLDREFQSFFHTNPNEFNFKGRKRSAQGNAGRLQSKQKSRNQNIERRPQTSQT